MNEIIRRVQYGDTPKYKGSPNGVEKDVNPKDKVINKKSKGP